MRIDTIEEWEALAIKMRSEGYSHWTSQYSTYCPEGYHAWFYKTASEEIEVVTYNEEIHNAILSYNRILSA